MPKLAASLLCIALAPPLGAQTFDAASVKPHDKAQALQVPFRDVPRPDGGVTMTNVSVRLIIARAYGLGDIVNLPGWANSDRYDVNATASLTNPTTAQRAEMLKAMLADRFKLALHVEPREQPTYDLVLARKDRSLGSGLTPIGADCAKIEAERTVALQATGRVPERPMPDLALRPPPCSLRAIGTALRDRSGDGQGAPGDLLEGEGTMAALVTQLRMNTGRLVVDKTGLAGSYKIRMNYDQLGALRGPDLQVQEKAGPSVFVALPEQLGLKLESSKTMVDTLVIDHLEKPSEN